MTEADGTELLVSIYLFRGPLTSPQLWRSSKSLSSFLLDKTLQRGPVPLHLAVFLSAHFSLNSKKWAFSSVACSKVCSAPERLVSLHC